MPVNPEDEDGVVPDMHAAFGITRAMGQAGLPEGSGAGALGAQRREDVWRDFGLDELVAGLGRMGMGGSSANPRGSEKGKAGGVRREGRRGGILSMR